MLNTPAINIGDRQYKRINSKMIKNINIKDLSEKKIYNFVKNYKPIKENLYGHGNSDKKFLKIFETHNFEEVISHPVMCNSQIKFLLGKHQSSHKINKTELNIILEAERKGIVCMGTTEKYSTSINKFNKILKKDIFHNIVTNKTKHKIIKASDLSSKIITAIKNGEVPDGDLVGPSRSQRSGDHLGHH